MTSRNFFNLNSRKKRISRQCSFLPVQLRFSNSIRSPTWWFSLMILLISFGVGFQSGTFLLCKIKLEVADPTNTDQNKNYLRPVYVPPLPMKKQLVLVAVMTSKDFLTSRAPTVMRTWGETIPGQVIFFSSEGSTTNDSKINLVSLPSVTDTYPPQKKSFLMMKFIHDFYLDHFEWFMRVDDDVYIRADNLEKLLRSIDNRKPLYIGQPGMGTKEEFGKLALGENENFCMGGPGIILSRETLKRFTPHIKTCLKNFHTNHEDVELGRCVHKFANTSCTWSYEMQHILYNHPNKTDGYRARNLVTTDILRAASLHSIKDTRVFTRLHNFALQRRIIDFEQRVLILNRQINIFDKILLVEKRIQKHRFNISKQIEKNRNKILEKHYKDFYRLLASTDRQIVEQLLHLSTNPQHLLLNQNHHPKAIDRELETALNRYFNKSSTSLEPMIKSTLSNIFPSIWKSESDGNHLEPGIFTLFTASQYSANTELPVRSIEPAFKQCLDEVVRTYMEEVNKISRSMGRFLEYKKTLYGYYKYEPRNGVNYIMDLFLMYRKFQGKKMSVPVRKRVHVVQKFRTLRFRELSSSYFSTGEIENLKNKNESALNVHLSKIHKFLPMPIHMIVPVSGRLSNLKRLLTNFNAVVMRSSDPTLFNVHLHIILMETSEDDGVKMSTIAEYVDGFIQLNQIDRIHLIEVKNTNFTRGFARSFGASRFNDTDLLFFIDLDMVFTRDLFPRIRHHTIFNKQVYFPIIFSQYDPSFWRTNKTDMNFQSFSLSDNIGYWRQYGFGMLGIYKADLGLIGNWNVEIHGWGKEDVDIYDKIVHSPNLTVFRTVDQSLMHIFHTKQCSTSLHHDQLAMCKGTKSITLGSQRVLVDHVLKLVQLNRI